MQDIPDSAASAQLPDATSGGESKQILVARVKEFLQKTQAGEAPINWEQIASLELSGADYFIPLSRAIADHESLQAVSALLSSDWQEVEGYLGGELDEESIEALRRFHSRFASLLDASLSAARYDRFGSTQNHITSFDVDPYYAPDVQRLLLRLTFMSGRRVVATLIEDLQTVLWMSWRLARNSSRWLSWSADANVLLTSDQVDGLKQAYEGLVKECESLGAALGKIRSNRVDPEETPEAE
jgi:hypothetical protein